ncbi:MAG: CBS domain-containing protein [Halorientalis sp.]
MSYQGDNPNAPRERQPTGPGTQRPQGAVPQRQTSQQPTQQSPQPPYQVQQQQWQQPFGQPQSQSQPQQPQQRQQPGGIQQPGTPQPTPTQQPQGQPQQTAPSQGASQQFQPGMTQQRQQGLAQQQRQQAGMVRPKFQPAKVEDLIVTDVVTAKRDTPIRTVVSSMAENNVGSVVILDDDGTTPIDLVTDRKVALALEGRPNIAEQNVEELLTGDLIVGTTEMTVFDALEKLNESQIRRLPIVDDDGALKGIVTLDDLLVFLGNQMSDALEVISAQIRR